MNDYATPAPTKDERRRPPVQDPFQAPAPTAAEIESLAHRIQRETGGVPLPPVAAPTSYTRALATPVEETKVPLLSLIQRTNDYLSTSAPEMHLVRSDRIQELEYHLKMCNFPPYYDYLDSKANDPTRRKYNIPPRLLVRSTGQ